MENYVIYKSSEGLINTLGGIAYCIDWCKANNHKLLIDMECNPNYKTKFSNYFYLKNFNFIENYELIDNKELQYKVPKLVIENTRNYYIDNIKILNNLSLNDKNKRIKVYCGSGGLSRQLISKYIRVKKDIILKLSKYKLNYQYQGIHFRNTDIKTELSNVISYINNKNIYFATDNINSLNEIKKILPNKNVINFSNLEETNNVGLHKVKEDKNELIFDLLKDIYLLYLSENLIGSRNHQ